MAAPALSLQILRNPPSLATANVVSVDPTAPNLSPVQIAQFVAAETLAFQFQIGNGISALETLTGYSYRVGLGGLNQPPQGGLATWGDGTVTVATQQPYNASAATIQAALNALNSNAGPSSGLVEVLSPIAAGAPYTVVWNTNGARALLTVDPSDLEPMCQVTVQRVQTGGASAREIQIIQITQTPLAYLSSLTVVGNLATGTLLCNTATVIQFLANNPSGQTIFEIEENDGVSIRKICQLPVVLNGYVIGPQSTISPIPAGGFQYGMVSIPSGQQSVTLTFPQPFTSTPSVFLPGLVGMPDSVTGFMNANWDKSTLTKTGVILWTDTIAPAAGYFIPWIAFQ